MEEHAHLDTPSSVHLQHTKPMGELLSQPLVSSPSTPISRVITTSDDSIIFTNPGSVESQNTSTSTQPDTHDQHYDHLPEINTLQEPVHHIQPEITPRESLVPLESSPDIPEERADEIQDFSQYLNTANLNQDRNSSLHETGSYIEDEESDKVLLNNYIGPRRSNRGSIATEQIDPLIPAKHRNSVMTSNSKTTSFDVATLEMEKQKTSKLQKRDKAEKAKKNNQQQHLSHSHKTKLNRATTLDDEKVLVGHKVSEGHVNYVVAYNMLTGIRVAVSRCSGIMKPLNDNDFRQTKKLVFDMSGNELTPSSKYDFKFKDYAPNVFRELRMLFGLDPADYLMSLTSKYILSELNSPGKSGSFFYFSRDYRFIIKTIHPAEHRQLKRILKDYHSHVKENPNTLISQFYGLHRVKMPIFYGKRRKIYFIVMNNLFPPHKDMHSTYDLKGSLLQRITTPNTTKHMVYKDMNWIQDRGVIQFGPDKLNVFLDQLRKDVKLLIRLNIMDYSFLIGIHDVSIGNHDEGLLKRKLSVFSPPSSKIEDLRSTNPTILDREHFPDIYPDFKNYFYREQGGISATCENNETLNQIYYFGIIDCLTDYSIIKRLETFWKSLMHDRKTISALPPNEYGERFLKFIEESINENTIQQKKNKND